MFRREIRSKNLRFTQVVTGRFTGEVNETPRLLCLTSVRFKEINQIRGV